MKLRTLKHRHRPAPKATKWPAARYLRLALPDRRRKKRELRRWHKYFGGTQWPPAQRVRITLTVAEENARARAAGMTEPFVPFVPWRLNPANPPAP